MLFRLTTLITLIAAAALAAPAAASAANVYVDHALGDDTNSCATPASACAHIQAAVYKAGTDGTVHVVDPGSPVTYDENVALIDGVSLVSDSPDRADVILDGGTAGPAIDAYGSVGATSTIEGFTIRGRGMGALIATRPVIVTHNLFDEPGAVAGAITELYLDGPAGASVVTENSFADPNPVAHKSQVGIASNTTTGPEISDNNFFDLTEGVHLGINSAGQPLIAHNKIVGIHADASNVGTGIYVLGGQPAISDNVIKSPVPAPGDTLTGVSVAGFAAPQVGATLRRNTVAGFTRGVDVEETSGDVSLDGDLIAGSTDRGLVIYDFGADQVGVADVTATNVTIADSGSRDVSILQARLTLDSSILDDEGIDATDSTCTITYSRGPKPGSAADGCNGFQTGADPGFVSPASTDYHLAEGSAMLDSGNPAAPAAGAVDLDGDARALALTCPGDAGTRDIGADEFVVACAPPPPPPPPPGGGSGSGTTTPPDPASGTTDDPATGDTQQTADETTQQVAADTDPPETTLVKSPRKRSARRKARFGFTSDEAGSSFLCKLDKGQFAPCTSPTKLKRLRRGRHSFRVAAVDAAGNADPTPAIYRFKTRARKHAA